MTAPSNIVPFPRPKAYRPRQWRVSDECMLRDRPAVVLTTGENVTELLVTGPHGDYVTWAPTHYLTDPIEAVERLMDGRPGDTEPDDVPKGAA